MIVDYDHNPNIDGEKRLQSLKESVQRALDEVSNTDEKTTTIIQKVFELMNGRIWKECYPVGSIYLSVNSTDPSTLFGGSWERIQDRFLLASGNSYGAGSTGGSAKATLPSHTHTVGSGGFQIWGAKAGTGSTEPGNQISGNDKLYAAVKGNSTSNYKWLDSVDSKGVRDVSQANMPPYLAVYVWKRTA